MYQTAITGMGVVSTAGHELETFWNTLESGTITYDKIPEFVNDDNNYRIKVGGKIVDEQWQNNVDEKIKEKYGRASAYVVSASDKALKDSGLCLRSKNSHTRVGICLGSTMGEIQEEQNISYTKHLKGLNNKSISSFFNKYNANLLGIALREYMGIPGPTYVLSAACASGNYSVGLGKQLLDANVVDIVVAGGVDVFSSVAFTGFQRLLFLSNGLQISFVKESKGLVVGEGCGIVIMENLKHAKKRNANIRGIISGIGLAADGYHMTTPHPEGKSTVKAIKSAMNQAKISTDQIDYISAHGTGTAANDKAEARALQTIFNSKKIPPTSSIKSMLGHPMGAASALEIIASVQMMEKGTILPTMNFENFDENCNLDCVPNQARDKKIQCVLSNSFAFGGQVSSIILEKAVQ